MTLLALCHACQFGLHDEHRPVPQAGIPGLLGSRWECPCTGDCKPRPSLALNLAPDVTIPPGHTLGVISDDGRARQIVRAGICWPGAAIARALTAATPKAASA